MRSSTTSVRDAIRRLVPPRPGAVVLGYHRVADPATVPGGDPYDLCVHPDNFARQMATLRTLGRPVSLDRLIQTLRRGEPIRGMIAVTFDDAYECVLRAALPVLEREEIPATVFFVTGASGREFWWDRMVALLAEADPSAPFRISVGGYEVEWQGIGSLCSLRSHLHRALSVLEDDVRFEILDQLAGAWNVSSIPPLPRAVTSAEADELLASPWVEAGAHSVSHPPLAEIQPERAREEIEQSREMLSAHIGAEIAAFSYPHGSHDGVVGRFARDAGYACACTTQPDSVRIGTDPFALPRVWPGNHAGLRFQHLRPYTGTLWTRRRR